MFIVVVGAGAVGTWLATELARAGEEVTLLVPPGAVPEGGALKITVDDRAQDEQRWAIVPAASDAPAPADLAILAVNLPDLADAARRLAAAGGAQQVLTLAPSANGEQIVAATFGADHVCAGVTTSRLAADHRGAADLWHSGPLWLRAPAAIAAMLARAVPTERVPDVAPWRLSLAALAAPRALAALADRPFADVLADRRLGEHATAILREAARALAAAGTPLGDLPDVPADALLRLAGVPGLFLARFLRSHPALLAAPAGPEPLQQSLRHRRATEVDDLNGALAALARAHGLTAPLNDRVTTLVHDAERTGKLFTFDELAHALTRRA